MWLSITILPTFPLQFNAFIVPSNIFCTPILTTARRAPFNAMSTDLNNIRQKILDFRNERDWAQFHDPKNLAEALSIEAGELLENFLWKTTEQSSNLTAEELKNVKEELADIFIFLTYLSEEYNIDLLKEVEKKIAVNEAKYPVEKAKGSNRKYTEL